MTFFNCTEAGSYYSLTRQNCYAIGKKVFISVELKVNIASPPTSAQICVAPAGYRPVSTLNNKGFVSLHRGNGYTDIRPALASINTNGVIFQLLSSALQVDDVLVIALEYMRS